MNEYLSSVNSGIFYLLVAGILGFITMMCFVFLVKSYKAGVKTGIDKKLLKKTITASATFTLLPSISILLGVIALSGTLGVPFSWLRLSVVGALQYELNVAEIAAQSIGLISWKDSESAEKGKQRKTRVWCPCNNSHVCGSLCRIYWFLYRKGDSKRRTGSHAFDRCSDCCGSDVSF